MARKTTTGVRRQASTSVQRSAKTGSFSKRGGYSSSAKPVSQLKPPPSGVGAGSKKKK